MWGWACAHNHPYGRGLGETLLPLHGNTVGIWSGIHLERRRALFVNLAGPDFRKRHGADGNRLVTKPCDLDKVRQEALKTLFSKSSLDAASLERHLKYRVFYWHVEVSVVQEAAVSHGQRVRERHCR
jgi:hypothetical protein